MSKSIRASARALWTATQAILAPTTLSFARVVIPPKAGPQARIVGATRLSALLRRNDGYGHVRTACSSAILGATLAASCAIAAPAAAHGFGQRYDLPLPLSLYLFGAAAAVVASFLVVGLFARHALGLRGYARIDLLATPLGRCFVSWPVKGLLKLVAVVLFVFVLIAGLCGNQNPYQNIAPTLVWVIWWVGLAIVSALIGDLWALINPWRTIFDAASRLAQTITGRGLALRLSFPEALGVWPAVALLLGVSWTELVFPSPALPTNIAWLALAYSLLTWVAMAAFGAEVWIRHGEVFSVFFSLFARFAPTEPSVRDATGDHGLALRPFASGLLANEPTSTSMVAFILLVLSAVLYDGLLATPEWADLERPLTRLLHDAGGSGTIIVRSIGLIVFWAAFLGAYLAISAAMSRMAGQHAPGAISRSFASTLIPIAIAYHLAHYLVYLVIQGQYIIPLASDPLGYGWNLFGTAGYHVDIAIVGARFAWYAAVSAIVAGHVAAVFLADVRAHQIFTSARIALRSQVPLTALMVVYTCVSLSILSEPIVERRAPAQPVAAKPGMSRIPEDALVVEPETGQLQQAGPGRTARQELTYRVLGSVFHDGTQMTTADLIYAYVFAYRWSSGVNGGTHYDPSIATATAPLRQRFAAVRVAGVDTASKSFRVGDVEFRRDLFVIDVYADIPPGDPEQNAIFAPPWSTLPWHLIALMEQAVERGWAAFSQGEAEHRGVPWLDLVRSATIVPRLAALADRFERDGYRPDALRSLVSDEQARRRWAALSAFYRTHGHLLVTNGPYSLKDWSGESATLEVFRDLSYPLGVGSYDVYAVPRRGYIAKVERVKGGLRLDAEIETLMKFMRDYRIERQPMQSVDAVALRRSAPECRYMVLDAGGAVVLTGVVRPAADLVFRIELDDKLNPGTYTVMSEIVVNDNTMNAMIAQIPVVVGEGR